MGFNTTLRLGLQIKFESFMGCINVSTVHRPIKSKYNELWCDKSTHIYKRPFYNLFLNFACINKSCQNLNLDCFYALSQISGNMKWTVLIILVLLGLIGNMAANRDKERQIKEGMVENYIKLKIHSHKMENFKSVFCCCLPVIFSKYNILHKLEDLSSFSFVFITPYLMHYSVILWNGHPCIQLF